MSENDAESNHDYELTQQQPTFMAKFATHLASALVGDERVRASIHNNNMTRDGDHDGGALDFECYWRTRLLERKKGAEVGQGLQDDHDVQQCRADLMFLDVSTRGSNSNTCTYQGSNPDPSVGIWIGALVVQGNSHSDIPASYYYKSGLPLSQDALERHFEEGGFDLVSSPPAVTARNFADALRSISDQTTVSLQPSSTTLELVLQYTEFGLSVPLVLERCSKSLLQPVVVVMLRTNLKEHDELLVDQSCSQSKPDKRIITDTNESSRKVESALVAWWQRALQSRHLGGIEGTFGSPGRPGRVDSSATSTNVESVPITRMAGPTGKKRARPITKIVQVRPRSKKNKRGKAALYASDSSDSS